MNIIIAAILATPFLAGGETQDKEAKDVVKEFRSIYFLKTTSDEERVAAIQRLARTPHILTARILGKLLLIAPDAHRMEAATAFGSFTLVRGAAALVANALISRRNGNKTDLRVALVRTLGSLRQITILPILHRLVGKDDVVVAKAVIEVISSFGRRESLPVLIKYLRKCERKPSNIVLSYKVKGGRPPKIAPGEGRKDLSVRITADEKESIRYNDCRPALKVALRNITGHHFPDWKSWNRWWRSGGAYGK
jgi:hypothetical protein